MVNLVRRLSPLGMNMKLTKHLLELSKVLFTVIVELKVLNQKNQKGQTLLRWI